MVEVPAPSSVEAMRTRLSPHVRRTPVVDVAPGRLAGPALTLKLESLQVTGTFKPRGAFATLLGAHVSSAGVVGASGGNFGLALAYAARALGHAATVFVPASSPREKVDGLAALGATVVRVDGAYADALAASERHAATTGALLTHAYDLPGNVIGAATLGAEIEEQVGCPEVLHVAVGGGGLIAGLAAWFRDRCRIVAVESEGCPTLHTAVRAGEPTPVEVGGLAASSLGARVIGEHCWATREWIDDTILVTDDEIRDTQRALWRELRVVAEPGGATALAGARVLDVDTDEHHVVVVCGANVDPATVAG